jgi:hypothetical protein
VVAPLVEVPLVEVPLVEMPLVEVPLVEMPLVEVPLVEMPLVEMPLVEMIAVLVLVIETFFRVEVAPVAGIVFAADEKFAVDAVLAAEAVFVAGVTVRTGLRFAVQTQSQPVLDSGSSPETRRVKQKKVQKKCRLLQQQISYYSSKYLLVIIPSDSIIYSYMCFQNMPKI